MKSKIIPDKVNLYTPKSPASLHIHKLPCFMPLDGDFSDLQFNIQKPVLKTIPYTGDEKQTAWFSSYKYPTAHWDIAQIDNEEFTDVVLLGAYKVNSYTPGFSILLNDTYALPVHNEDLMFAFTRPVVGQRFQTPFKFVKDYGSKILKLIPAGCENYKKLEVQHTLSQLKNIKATELKPGFIYRKKPHGNYVLHLGKVNCDSDNYNRTREVDKNFCLSLHNFDVNTVTIEELIKSIEDTNINWGCYPHRARGLASIVQEVGELKNWNKYFSEVKRIDQSPNRPLYKDQLLTVTKA